MPGGSRITPRRLNVGYVSPERQYAVSDVSAFAGWSLKIGLYSAWLFVTLAVNPFGWTGGQQLVAGIGGVALAYVVADGINKALAQAGGGYGLARRGSQRLQAEFLPGRFRIRIGNRWHRFNAMLPHTFSMREHERRYEESRAEERARAEGMAQGPDYYRRAWEIILDFGEEPIPLAAVGDEKAARAIVRKLHKLDAFARGSAGAGTKTKSEDPVGASPSGRRPKLD